MPKIEKKSSSTEMPVVVISQKLTESGTILDDLS